MNLEASMTPAMPKGTIGSHFATLCQGVSFEPNIPTFFEDNG